MFKVGDIIIGKANAPYVHTGEGILCRVLHVDGDLLIVERKEGEREFEWTVEGKYFAYPDSNGNALTLLNEED